MQRRDRLHITYDILEYLTNGSSKPTKLMYKANLTHKQLKEYLDELISKQLITKRKTKTSYVIELTDKGYDFYKKLKSVIEFEQAFQF